MPMRTALNVLLLLAVTSAAEVPRSDEALSREGILELMYKVRGYQMEHPWKQNDRNWIRATYYTGVMAMYRVTKDPKVLNQALRWAEKHNWQAGTERAPANRKTCGQTYLELYFLQPKRARIDHIRAYVDSRMKIIAQGRSPRKDWYYCDTLYVGPPTIAMLGKATGERKYFDYLHRVYWDVADHLFDREHGLFYRDAKYFNVRTKHGKRVFWSRGNGWVIAGIARVLEYLPADDPVRPRYVKLLRTMAAALAKRQPADGLWRSNLDDPKQHPNPETSGTAFFCYAIAWGINSGVLPRERYLPVVAKAWRGLAGCVDADGRLGYVQPVGRDPQPATREMTHEYAMGAFLLAGSEMLRLARPRATSGGAKPSGGRRHPATVRTSTDRR